MTDGDETFLAARGVRVWKSGRKRVIEDADRFIECDPVLPSIGVRLRMVPFKVHCLMGDDMAASNARAHRRAEQREARPSAARC